MEQNVIEAMIRPEMGGLLIALYVVGVLLKQAKRIPDEIIPLAIVLLAVAGACGILRTISVEAILQGVFCAAVTVLGNQFIKQARKGTDKLFEKTLK